MVENVNQKTYTNHSGHIYTLSLLVTYLNLKEKAKSESIGKKDSFSK